MITFSSSYIDTCRTIFSIPALSSNDIARSLAGIKEKKQTFYTCIEDKEMWASITTLAEQYKDNYEKFVLLGIGGSALGAHMLKSTLCTPQQAEQLVIFDHLDPLLFHEQASTLDLAKTLFIVISKSGTTLETMAQYFYFKHQLEEHKLELRKHMIVITDEHKGFLREEVQRYHLDSLVVPEGLGGRFSVLSAVGLFPALLLGIDAEALLRGAQQINTIFHDTNPEHNLPYLLATIQYHAHQNKRPLHIFFPYSTKLQAFGAWWTQLIAESIGKHPTIGITPITSVGVTDQHSTLQLYSDGPLDKFFIFLRLLETAHPITIPTIIDDAYRYLSGRSFHELTLAELHGTTTALIEKGQALFQIDMDRLDAEHVGSLIFLMEATTAFLGELFQINAFNQPGVERSKQVTAALLHSS